MSLSNFTFLFTGVIDKLAPRKKKYVRANNAPFMSKILRKEFMKRSKLKNDMQKNCTYFNIRAYKEQRNICTSLVRKEKKSLLCKSRHKKSYR